MRPPNRAVAVVALTSLLVLGLATVGAIGATTGSDTTETAGTEPVIVQNESTYHASQTLQFDVSTSSDTYELRTESGVFIDMLTAEDGNVTLDSSRFDARTYVLVHHDSDTTEYRFTIEREETATTPSQTTGSSEEAMDSAITAEDGGSYEIATVLQFGVPHEEGSYELRKEPEGLYVDQLRITNQTVVVDTEGLDAGEYALVHTESDQVTYQFTLVEDGTAMEETTESSTATTTSTAEEESPTENQTEESSSSAPGFGVGTASIALLAGGVLLLGRRR